MLSFEELSQLLPQIYQSFEIPLFLYETGESDYAITCPEDDLFQKLLGPHVNTFEDMTNLVNYHVNDLFYTIACVNNRSKGYKLIIGPVPATQITKETGKKFTRQGPSKLTDEEIESVMKLPVYQQIRLFNIFSLLTQLITGQTINPQEIGMISEHSTNISIAHRKTENYYQIIENQDFHNSLEFEQRYLSYIENGNLLKLKKLFSNPVNVDVGILSNDNMRQVKNLFIASITLATRAAIRGGLEPQIAYQLSDLAILEMEKMTKMQSMLEWQRASMYQLAEEVAATKVQSEISPLVKNILNYIATHLNEPLSVQAIAKTFYQNRSYLSRLFKAEMQISLGNYIQNRKILEAKDLLRFSDKSISEISNFLGYSSQSYFQTVFKKKTGQTPAQFRKKMSKM